MALDYTSPTLRRSVPYPLVLNPRTRKPFTAPTIADLHRRLWVELAKTAEEFLAKEAGLALPDWPRINEAPDDLTDLCLFDSLFLAQADLEPPDQEEVSI